MSLPENAEPPRKAIHSDSAPAALGPYSQAVQAGELLFMSGQIPLTTVGDVIEGGIEAQTHQVLKNLRAVVSAAGGSLDDIVRTTIFLTDLEDFQAVNRVYGTYFTELKPARACVQVAALPKGVAVEIDAIACLR
jgi:2-iminobutanoate/2-iminopropanoate deaminase